MLLATTYATYTILRCLLYQLSGGAGLGEVVVAINFAGEPLVLEQEVKVSAARSAAALTFTEMTGNGLNSTTTTDANNRIQISVPARSYAVYVATALLPVELADFRASADAKGKVTVSWETVTEEALAYFAVEASENGRDFVEVGRAAPRQQAGVYQLEDDRPWQSALRYYRLRTVSADGSEQRSTVQRVSYTQVDELKISPNPAKEELLVSGIPANSDWSLLATDGREMPVTGQVSAAGLRINLKGIPAGIYWLRAGGSVEKVIVRE